MKSSTPSKKTLENIKEKKNSRTGHMRPLQFIFRSTHALHDAVEAITVTSTDSPRVNIPKNTVSTEILYFRKNHHHNHNHHHHRHNHNHHQSLSPLCSKGFKHSIQLWERNETLLPHSFKIKSAILKGIFYWNQLKE